MWSDIQPRIILGFWGGVGVMQEEQCKWIKPRIFILGVKSDISYPVTTGFSGIPQLFSVGDMELVSPEHH